MPHHQRQQLAPFCVDIEECLIEKPGEEFLSTRWFNSSLASDNSLSLPHPRKTDVLCRLTRFTADELRFVQIYDARELDVIYTMLCGRYRRSYASVVYQFVGFTLFRDNGCRVFVQTVAIAAYVA